MKTVTAIASLVALLSSCASPPPPEEPAEPVKNHGFTGTWIKVIGSMGWPGEYECGLGTEWIERETDCRDVGCKYIADIAADYVATCATELPEDERAKYEQLQRTFKRRAKEHASECTTTPFVLLEAECSEQNRCAERAQGWATRCAQKVGSPLLVELLEQRVGRFLGQSDFTLDTRSCETLAEVVVEADKCDDQFECKDAAKRVKTFLGKCGQGQLSELDVVLAQAAYSVFEKAGAEHPVYVNPKKSRFQDAPAVVADGRAKVISVCETDIDEESSVREALEACEDGSVRLVTVYDEGTGAYLLRKGTFPSVNPETRFLVAPWLTTDGEKQAALDEIESQVGKAVREFADAAEKGMKWRDTVAALAESLKDVRFHELPQERMEKIWAPHDEALVELFTKLGWSKGHGVLDSAGDFATWAFIERGKKYAFADLTEDAEVLLGTHQPFASLDLAAALPKSFEAYRSGLVLAKEKIDDYAPSAGELSAARDRTVDWEIKCRRAVKRGNQARQALRDCTFVEGQCSAEVVESRSQTIGEARATWLDSHTRFVVSIPPLSDKSNLKCDVF